MLLAIAVPGSHGGSVALSELVTVKEGLEDRTIYHKNLRKVTYVTGDVAGKEESPVYAIMNMKDAIANLKLPEGYAMKQYSSVQPWLEEEYSMKWDGEWHITYEVFRDLGGAFAVVLVIIYILVVAWFRNFLTPLVDHGAIPLTLVGSCPATYLRRLLPATSMIGFIALGRHRGANSILRWTSSR
jgi:multidrug efflux pump subunit AcrB